MSPEEKLDELRSQVKKYQNERDLAILEKGFAAQGNEDLRENAQYDYWLEQEIFYTGKIKTLLEQIHEISIKLRKKPKRKTIKKEKVQDSTLTQKHKWL